jgi:hypothetical protein
MPILSSFADMSAQAYGIFSPALATGNYYSIQTATVTSGGASSITFSSIPTDGTYTHLQIRIFGQSGGTTYPADNIQLLFNGASSDNGADSHYLRGDGSAASAGARANGTGGELTSCIGRNGNWGGSIIDILDYTNTHKNIVVRALGGADANGSGYIALASLLSPTSAINAININPNGNNFVAGSVVALYGIK